MRAACFLVGLFLAAPALAQDVPLLPPANRTPALVLDHKAAHSPVMSLAFTPDGSTLYVGGLDKLVRAYAFNKDGTFTLSRTLRVPIGPGNAGAVNAIAVSPDGKWVAVAGRAPFREEAGFGVEGLVIKTADLPALLRRDVGVVYLFDRTKPQGGGGTVIRGAAGDVRAVTFATPKTGLGTVLVTAGMEWEDEKRIGVVRAYEVETGKQLGARRDLPDCPLRPGLVAWPSGARGVRVGIAWPKGDAAGNPDGKATGNTLIWDLPKNKITPLPEGSFNSPLALRVGENGARELIAAGFVGYGGPPANAYGEVAFWVLDGSPVKSPLKYPPVNGTYYMPIGVAAAGDTTAVLLENTDRPQESMVRPTDLLLVRPGAATRRIPLTGLSQLPEFVPTLAASPDGRFVAVGGFTDYRVEVYPVAGGPPVVLPGAAGGFGGVAFITGGKLWLGGKQGNPTAKGDGLVFDFAAGGYKPNAGGGTVDTPAGAASGAWPEPRPGVPVPVSVTVGGRVIPFTLLPGQRPTAWAFLPAKPAWDPTLDEVLAVAHFEARDAVTLITLFDAKTGRRIRQLVGPEQPVAALAFCGSKPYLAAVGADRAAYVWSLKEVDRGISTVEGLVLTDRGKDVIVAAVGPGIPGLAVGDVIEAVGVPKGKLAPVASALAFRAAVMARPVGSSIAVQVKGKSIVLPIRAAVGQRGPLFALWVEPAAKGEGEWVGWAPNGLYDANSEAAEARVGWLSATGDKADPVSFAGVGQYRKRFRRPGLLKDLFDKGEPPAPPEQSQSKLILQLATAAGARPRPVRDGQVFLDVLLEDEPEDFVRAGQVLRWRATGPGGPTPWQGAPFKRGELNRIDVSGYAWTRGTHTFDVTLHPAKDAPAALTAQVTTDFVPLPPGVFAIIDGAKAADRVDTKKETINVAAGIDSAPGGEVAVKLRWTDPQGLKGERAMTVKGKETTAEALKLKPGTTTLELIATSSKAGMYAALETSLVSMTVTYTPEKAARAPQIGPLAVVPAGRPTTPAGPLLVTTPTVKLSAAIEADTPLTAVEWDLGNGKWVPNAQAVAGMKKVTAERDVTVPPGEVLVVRLRATAQNSPAASVDRNLVYAPLPATVTLDRPAAAVTDPAVVLTGKYEPPAGGIPFEIHVLATSGGRSRLVHADPIADPKVPGGWRASLTLLPGENRLGVVLTNKWQEEARPDLASVRFRRPPAVFQVRPIDAGDTAVGDVDVWALAVQGMDPTGLRVEDKGVTTRPPRKLAGLFGIGLWELKAPAVALKHGDMVPGAVSVAAGNADAFGPAVLVQVVRKPPRKMPAPSVALSHRGNPIAVLVKTNQQKFTFKLAVMSAGPLARVEVAKAAAPGAPFTQVTLLDLTGAAARADGSFQFTAEREVQLRPGVNVIRVVAVNAGGARPVEFQVSYTPLAARVRIDGVFELQAGGKTNPLGPPIPGRALQAKQGFLQVVGQVRWPLADDPAIGDPNLAVVLSANGMVHLPVQLDVAEPGSAVRTFKAPLFLPADLTQVEVHVRAPGAAADVPQEGITGQRFVVHCSAPDRQQRLHVVVIGVGVPESGGPALARAVVQAVGGKLPAGQESVFASGKFTQGAFTEAYMYPPLVAGVDLERVRHQLALVRDGINRLSGQNQRVNDVVIVYYQGWDMADPQSRKWLLHTNLSLEYTGTAAARRAVRLSDLPQTPGAQLIVLNVVNPGADTPSRDGLPGAIPVVRYAWSNPAALAEALVALNRAVRTEQSVGDVLNDVNKQVQRSKDLSTRPYENVPPELKQRLFGLALGIRP